MEQQPELQSSDLFYWNAYWVLSTDRPPGGGVSSIPFLAVDRYAARYNVTGADFDDLLEVVLAMDSIFVTEHSKRQSTK